MEDTVTVTEVVVESVAGTFVVLVILLYFLTKLVSVAVSVTDTEMSLVIVVGTVID